RHAVARQSRVRRVPQRAAPPHPGTRAVGGGVPRGTRAAAGAPGRPGRGAPRRGLAPGARPQRRPDGPAGAAYGPGTPMRVLLLGGTAEARDLAALLVADGVDVESSLAGRVARPRLPVGKVRVGGFGGVTGLRSALVAYDVVVDATHPFA